MIKTSSNRIVVLFVLAALCLLYPAGMVFIEFKFGLPEIILSAVGAIGLFISFSALRSRPGDVFQRDKLKKYFRLFTYIALIIVLAILVNYVFVKADIRFDLTKNKQHTLSANTIKYIANLKQKVKLTALYVGIPPKYLEDMFKEYERASQGKITSEIIDPLVQIGYAAQFGQVINGRESKVIVQGVGKSRLKKEIDFTDSALTEEQLTNEIIRVTRKEIHVYFLAGHGEFDINNEKESGYSEFARMLRENNAVCRTLFLGLNGKIPPDCDVLIVAGPHDFLAKGEEKVISDYLASGGDALFLVENVIVSTPDKPLTANEMNKNPSLNSILNPWGIRINDDVVVDLASHASGDVGSPATKNYLSHRAIVKGLDYTFYLRPRSIAMLAEKKSVIKLAPLVLTESTKESWGETDRYLNVKYDPGVDTPGPVPIAFVAWEPKLGDKKSDTRLIVFTDGDFLSNAYINFYSNAEMGVNVVNWLAEGDYQVFVDKKKTEVQNLNLTSKQKRAVGFILLLMPVIIAAAGISVWIKTQE